MPPSLPTGTVSQASAGTRTFPPESDRARAPAASPEPSRPPQARTQTPLPAQHSSPAQTRESSPSAVIPRREHDAVVSREHDRVAELERENELLRDYIEEQATERQAVIERYERLLDRRDVDETPPAAVEEPSFDVRGALSTLRSRIASRLGLD